MSYFQHSNPSSRASSIHQVQHHHLTSELSPQSSSLSSQRDPFVDPRLSLDSHSTGGDPFRSQSPYDSSTSRDSSHERRPALPSRPSEVQRQLTSALEEELDTEAGLRTPRAEQPPRVTQRRSVSGSSTGSKKEPGLWSQFQSGASSLILFEV